MGRREEQRHRRRNPEFSVIRGSCSWDYVPDYSLCGAENLREWKFHGKYVKRRR